MKSKFYLPFVIFLISFSNLHSQGNYYYYYKGQKIPLILDKSALHISVNESFQKSSITPLEVKDFDVEEKNFDSQIERSAKVEFEYVPSDIEFLQKLSSLNQNENIDNVSPYFMRSNTSSIGTSKYFYVKLKSTDDLGILTQVATQKKVKINKQVPNMPEWYILSVTKESIGNSLDMTNYFYETSLFSDVDPAFLFDFSNQSSGDNNLTNQSPMVNCTNDTNFSQLWGLENGVNQNIDINACQSWTIAQGNNINVAVVDHGVQMTHNDLIPNLSPLSYDTVAGSSPSSFDGSSHGLHIAGTIAAVKDNNLQVVGVAPLSKIMSVSNPLYSNNVLAAQLASGISWAYQNGADVMNNSYGDYNGTLNHIHSIILEDAIINAMTLGRDGKGTLMVFVAGNVAPSNTPQIDYPGNFNDSIITVGSINSAGQRSIFNATNGQGSGYGEELDVVAPGSGIYSTTASNTIGMMNGTSMAAPHVTGVVALILSVNPCLSGQQVRDILERTAQKVGTYSYAITPGRPNGTWNNEMGYGLIDAYAAVQMAQQMYSASLDLMVKDGTDDIGNEPNYTTQYMWASSDIWIRNQADGVSLQEHQNPEYSPTVPNYAYVRVTNKSCFASDGSEQLKFYWAKAGTSLEWPNSWDGNHFFPSPDPSPLPNIKLGDEVGSVTIPVLQPGQETIVQLPFMVPNPADYSFAGSDQWHFCLLARIEAANDPSNEANGLYANVLNNNNIAWKNVTIVDLVANRTSGIIAVGNPFNEPRTFHLELVKEDLETGKPIYEEAEVSIKMDKTLYNAWERGGKIAQELDSTNDEKKKIVKGNNVILDNIAFNANEMGTLNLTFNFLTEELTEKSKFVYHVIQRDDLTGNIIGGETYVIKKQARPLFNADAGGDKEVDMNEPITITAAQISEPAIYNWYDTNGDLVFVGKDLTIATQVATKYKLEVIATTDGFKDYSEVEINLKPSSLTTIAPNPSTSNITIGYKLNQTGSAYLMIIGSYGTTGATNNYILDIDSTETNINIANYPNGFYTVALVCNGEIVDAKTLFKQ